jgi:hypothetical protein
MTKLTNTTGTEAPTVTAIDPVKKEQDRKAWEASFDGDYIGKDKKRQWEDSYGAPQREQAEQVRRHSYGDSNQAGGVTLSGSAKEQEGQMAGLETAKAGYGQNLMDTGQDIQRIKNLQRGRTDQSGGDPVSAAIMGQKQGAMANAQRNLASSGVKGGVAANAIANVGLQQDQQIAASLYGQQRQSISDERSLASNTLAGTVGLMQGGGGVGNSGNMPNAPKAQGMFDSVICTELHRQGIMSTELYLIDSSYGVALRLRNPEVFEGYLVLGRPIAKLMRKSKLFTAIMAPPTMAWAKNMAGDHNLVGGLISFIGMPLCTFIGKIKLSILGAKYV